MLAWEDQDRVKDRKNDLKIQTDSLALRQEVKELDFLLNCLLPLPAQQALLITLTILVGQLKFRSLVCVVELPLSQRLVALALLNSEQCKVRKQLEMTFKNDPLYVRRLRQSEGVKIKSFQQ